MSSRIESFNPIINQVTDEVAKYRKADYPVHPLILNRWSPRSYSSTIVSDEALYTVLEAARWAPSSSNLQPWRFIVAKTDEQQEIFQTFIKPNNRLWTDHVPVLVLLASTKLKENSEPNGAHAFDAGAAWGVLALQASLLGLSTRAVGGFDKQKAREVLELSDDIELHAVIAIGYRGETDSLHESLQEREKPTSRRPIHESIIEVKGKN